ncbi:MAG TPA: hypothetical protein VFF88_03060 [Methylocella sp.]|nr:hypothetical protein [Methylocella sp.]
MTIFIIWAVLAGFTLGRFFKVLVLVPASLVLFAMAAVRALNLEHSFWRMALEFLALAVAVQIGYGSVLLSAAAESVRLRVKGARPMPHPAAPPAVLRQISDAQRLR